MDSISRAGIQTDAATAKIPWQATDLRQRSGQLSSEISDFLADVRAA
jgi:hypothetical protein